MIHLVTFSDESMSRARELCVSSALQHGCDTANGWQPSYLKHFPTFQEAWTTARGFGWWHWKPIMIQQALHEHLTGEIVIWADAGVEFINNVSHIIDRMDQDIFLFGNNWEHAHWCKRDVVQAIWPSKFWEPHLEYHSDKAVTWERFDKQAQASVIFFHVSDYTREFVKEWLDWCLSGARIGAGVSFGKDNPAHRDDRMTWSEFRPLIDDSPSVFPNHPEFREHRHDQAILTTMAYREGIKLHYWPAIYNGGQFTYEKSPEYVSDTYPAIFHHHRRRNHEWSNAA